MADAFVWLMLLILLISYIAYASSMVDVLYMAYALYMNDAPNIAYVSYIAESFILLISLYC